MKQVPSHHAQEKSIFWKIISLEGWLKFFALLGILISLFGYGVVMGVAHSMNLDHGSMIGGAFELLSLSWIGVLAFFNKINGLNFWSFFEDVILLFSKTVPLIFILLALIYFSASYYNRVEKYLRKKIALHKDQFFFHVFGKSIGVLGILATTLGGFSILLSLAWAFLNFSASRIILLVIIIVPFLGFRGGEDYFSKYVLNSKKCSEILTGSQRVQRFNLESGAPASQNSSQDKGGAFCALIKTADKEGAYITHGRVVLSSPSYMLLYNFETGVGQRIPIAHFVVQSIDDAGIQALMRAREAEKTKEKILAKESMRISTKPRAGQ